MSDTDEVLENIEQAVRDVEHAVEKVETAVKEKWSALQSFGVVVVGLWIWFLLGDIWHAKWRYAAHYNVSSDKVLIDDYPHDCAFLTAPLGEKYCHYERVVSTLRWATSMSGNPIVSYDEGNTWSAFTPNATATVPKAPTVEEVHISWKKISE